VRWVGGQQEELLNQCITSYVNCWSSWSLFSKWCGHDKTVEHVYNFLLFFERNTQYIHTKATWLHISVSCYSKLHSCIYTISYTFN